LKDCLNPPFAAQRVGHRFLVVQAERRATRPLLLRKADATDKFLKPCITPQRVHSGIHPDKGQSIGSFAVGLLQRCHGFFFFIQVDVRRGKEKMANVMPLCQIKSPIEHLPRLLLLAGAGNG
jgi:hypothetical protein